METPQSESYASYLHLPPREAWKNPDKWLQPLRPDQKLNLPLDDRGFVKTDNAIDMVMDLFKPTYKFEYDPDNFETRDDVHHFYGTYRMYVTAREELIAAGNPHDFVPMQFRNNPNNMGLIHRHLHNTFHLKSNLVPMPEIEPMAEYLERFRIGKQILNKTVKAAEETIKWDKHRMQRRLSVTARPEVINNAEIDAYGEMVLNDLYNRHFGSMVRAIDELRSIGSQEIMMPNGPLVIDSPDPHKIIAIGKAASRNAINYTEQIRAS